LLEAEPPADEATPNAAVASDNICSMRSAAPPGGLEPGPGVDGTDRLGVDLELRLGAAGPDHHAGVAAGVPDQDVGWGMGRPGERSA
jgi:hypothetical protein